MRERALAQAQAAALALMAGQDVGPLYGMPYAARDLFDVKGLPATTGSHLLEDNIAAADATVIRRLAQAGMILLGKTHTVQFAYGGVGFEVFVWPVLRALLGQCPVRPARQSATLTTPLQARAGLASFIPAHLQPHVTGYVAMPVENMLELGRAEARPLAYTHSG